MQEARWMAGRVRPGTGGRPYVSGVLTPEAAVSPGGLSGCKEVYGLDLQNTGEGNDWAPI